MMVAQQIIEAMPYLDWREDSFRPKNAPDKVVPFWQADYRSCTPEDAPGQRGIFIIVYPQTVRVCGEQSYGHGFDYLEIFQVIEDSRELWRGSHPAFLADMERILHNASREYLYPDSPDFDHILDDLPW